MSMQLVLGQFPPMQRLLDINSVVLSAKINQGSIENFEAQQFLVAYLFFRGELGATAYRLIFGNF